MQIKKGYNHCDCNLLIFMWAQLGLNQRPPDYESGATNQLSYGPKKRAIKAVFLCVQKYKEIAIIKQPLL